MLAAPYFATKKFKNWVNYEFKEENWEFKNWFFNIEYSVPYNASVFTLILMFSTVVPLILPLGSIFFYVKYMLDKYNIIYVCPDQFESAGKISRNKTINYSIFAIILYQISMVVVLVITQDIIMYTVLILISVIGTICIVYIVNGKNIRLNQVEDNKQRKISLILNPNTHNSEYSFLRNSFDEVPEDVSDMLKNAYIHPCERTFHAPVFKRSKNKNSISYLFEPEENMDFTLRKAKSDDGNECSKLLSDEDTNENNKSDL